MLAFLLLVLSGCMQAPAEAVDVEREAITGGVAETGYPAVFALAYRGQGSCTGTCVTPHIGVTAKHCVEGDEATDFSALFGDTELDARVVIPVTAMAAHESADIAVVAFDGECPAVIPHMREPLEDHVGEAVVMVGFGVTTEEANDAGIKRSGVATLFSVDPDEVMGLDAGELATSNDPAGTCNGDSGGPTFMTFDGVERLVGVTSRGSSNAAGHEWPCGSGRSIAVRTDSYTSFIDAFIAMHDPERAPAPTVPPPSTAPPNTPIAPPPSTSPPPSIDEEPAIAKDGCAVASGHSRASTALPWIAMGVVLAVARRRRV